ncbi:MAG: serine hydrolase domain-containing protein [Streptosporangiaceae bacterium]|jgi:D-alanyl-D-alanine carboxypeptidase
MRSAIPRTARRSTRGRLTAVATACALLSAGAFLSAGPASALAAQPRPAGPTLQAALRQDLSDYLTTRRTAEHISAVSLRITFPGPKPAISLADGTTRYDGGPPVSAGALWQIGSNTKAFTAVILLQLEAEGKLSIDDPIGTWLPEYPAWRHITIRQLLDMTSRIPNYTSQPAFAAALEANPSARFTTAQLVSYVTGLSLGPAGYNYTNTDYILAQMIIEKVTHDTYAGQLTRRIIDPLRLRSTCLAPYTCPPSDAARMPAGYLYIAGVPPSLLGQAMPPLALTWAQGAGGIISSLADMTTWDRALYSGQLLPPRQQHQLESLVSEATGQPIARTTLADPSGYGLGVQQQASPQTGVVWDYEGETFGYRVVLLYFPRSGMIIALAVNSATDNDDVADLAGSVYQTLQKAGAA